MTAEPSDLYQCQAAIGAAKRARSIPRNTRVSLPEIAVPKPEKKYPIKALLEARYAQEPIVIYRDLIQVDRNASWLDIGAVLLMLIVIGLLAFYEGTTCLGCGDRILIAARELWSSLLR